MLKKILSFVVIAVATLSLVAPVADAQFGDPWYVGYSAGEQLIDQYPGIPNYMYYNYMISFCAQTYPNNSILFGPCLNGAEDAWNNQ